MRVPLEWLREYVAVTDSAQEVATRLTMGGLEVEAIEESSIGPVLDVYVTPNRGDCLSLLGIAREVAALYDLPLRPPVSPEFIATGPDYGGVTIEIEEPSLCPRYAGRVLRGARIASSPAWMQARLEAAGMRPINNVVDVTNYVMLELGQPLHAFDLSRITGSAIFVRAARTGETIQTLDGELRALTDSPLVIADTAGPIGIAGIMGGAASEVGDATVDLFLESANFHPLAIRRGSRSLGLRTEASYRYERAVDPNGVQRAADRACTLLKELCRPETVCELVDVYPVPIEPKTIAMRSARAAMLLGIPEIDDDVAIDSLRRLRLGVEIHESRLMVTVPTFRADLVSEEDLVEEVGRVYGYENIPETLPIGVTIRGGDSAESAILMDIRSALVQAGLQEVSTHSLTAISPFDSIGSVGKRVTVRNALSAEVSGLRSSLIPSLLSVAQHNASRGRQAMALFEIGHVWESFGDAPIERISIAALLTGPMRPSGWRKDEPSPDADFGAARGVVEQLAKTLKIREISICAKSEADDALSTLHPGRSGTVWIEESYAGVIGELHPLLASRLSFRSRIVLLEVAFDVLSAAIPGEPPAYQSVSRYPAVVRDIAPRLAESITFGEVRAAIAKAEVENLRECVLADEYRGVPLLENQKSFTLSLTFRSDERTLTDAEVDDSLNLLRAALTQTCGAEFLV